MVAYINTTTEVVKTKEEWKKEFETMSLPKQWTDEVLQALNLKAVYSPALDDLDDEYKVYSKKGYIQDSNGEWYENWVIEDRFKEHVDINGNTVTVDDQKAAYQEEKLNNLINIGRNERNKRLAEDIDVMNAVRWAALTSDQQSAWTQYRQDLLDVPQQSDFPNTINWPTKP